MYWFTFAMSLYGRVCTVVRRLLIQLVILKINPFFDIDDRTQVLVRMAQVARLVQTITFVLVYLATQEEIVKQVG